MDDSDSKRKASPDGYRDRAQRLAIQRLLESGDLEIKGLVPWSSNYTYIAVVHCEEKDILAVYKPQCGERPLWDFETGSLCKREVAAYQLSAFLGFPNIPVTVLREGPQGFGAVQQYVEHKSRENFFTLRAGHRKDLEKIAVFDALVNNTDRKGGHLLLDAAGVVWAIDHGVTFHEDPKLRTVIWDYIDEPIPAPLLEALARLRKALGSGERICRELESSLTRREMRALQSRLIDLLRSRTFPSPSEDWPHIPWPPV